MIQFQETSPNLTDPILKDPSSSHWDPEKQAKNVHAKLYVLLKEDSFAKSV